MGFQRCDISSIPKRKKSDRLGLSGSSQATGVSLNSLEKERPTQLLCKVVRVGAKLSEKRARKKISNPRYGWRCERYLAPGGAKTT